MIGRSIGVVADGAGDKLPADLINPLFAFSLNRKLRYLYDGEYFRFRDKNGEADYPSSAPDMSEDVLLVKIYDQKEKHGYTKEDAIQADPALQPKIELQDGFYRAVFSGTEFLSVAQSQHVADEFYISFVGKSDYPRPGIGIWNNTMSITVEPSTEAVGKFTVNRNRGAMQSSASSNTYGCFYGYDPQQGNRVMSVNEVGHNVKSSELSNLNNIAIGRSDERYYIGEVLEGVMHLGDLKQKWGDLLTNKTQEIYKDYQ